MDYCPRPLLMPEVVDVALDIIEAASRFYLNTEFTIYDGLSRLKILTPEILTNLHVFCHEKGLSLVETLDGKKAARTLTEFVNAILIHNGQGSPSDEELELLFLEGP